LQNDLGAGYPVSALGVNQMSDNIKGGPSFLAFIASRPRFWQVAQKRIECGGSPTEKSNGVVEIVRHFPSEN
jgi:hypothetical protein